MLGALIVALVIVVVFPVGYMLTGLVVSALLGWFSKETVEATHEGSELLETNY